MEMARKNLNPHFPFMLHHVAEEVLKAITFLNIVATIYYSRKTIILGKDIVLRIAALFNG